MTSYAGLNTLGIKPINISNDASTTTINIGTGAAPKTVSLGSTDTTSTTNINSGSGGIRLPQFATAGILHNAITTGLLSSSLIVNADVHNTAGIVDTKLATISTVGKVSNSATTATSANTNNTIVARDGGGDFSASIITALGLNCDNITQSGSGSFTTGTGDVKLNGDVTLIEDFTQTGNKTFSTGTGNISLNGNTSVTGSNTLTTGTGDVTFGGIVKLTSTNTHALRFPDTSSSGIGWGLSSVGAAIGRANTASHYVDASEAGDLCISCTDSTNIVFGDSNNNLFRLTPNLLGSNTSQARLFTDTLITTADIAMTSLSMFPLRFRDTYDSGMSWDYNDDNVAAIGRSFNNNSFVNGSTSGDICIRTDVAKSFVVGNVNNIYFKVNSSNGNISQLGSGTFSTATGDVNLNGNTYISGILTSTNAAPNGQSIILPDSVNAGISIGSTSVWGKSAGTDAFITGSVANDMILRTDNGSSLIIGSAAGGTHMKVNATNITLASNTIISGSKTFSTGTGAVSLNGDTTISGSKTFSTGTGAVSLNGDTTLAVNKNLSMSGTSTLTTGTGNISLNGNTTVEASKSLTVTNLLNTSITTSNTNCIRKVLWNTTDWTTSHNPVGLLSWEYGGLVGVWASGTNVWLNCAVTSSIAVGTYILSYFARCADTFFNNITVQIKCNGSGSYTTIDTIDCHSTGINEGSIHFMNTIVISTGGQPFDIKWMTNAFGPVDKVGICGSITLTRIF